jgi:hypothetical protein
MPFVGELKRWATSFSPFDSEWHSLEANTKGKANGSTGAIEATQGDDGEPFAERRIR